jgi:hypothetical protein
MLRLGLVAAVEHMVNSESTVKTLIVVDHDDDDDDDFKYYNKRISLALVDPSLQPINLSFSLLATGSLGRPSRYV